MSSTFLAVSVYRACSRLICMNFRCGKDKGWKTLLVVYEMSSSILVIKERVEFLSSLCDPKAVKLVSQFLMSVTSIGVTLLVTKKRENHPKG